MHSNQTGAEIWITIVLTKTYIQTDIVQPTYKVIPILCGGFGFIIDMKKMGL